MNIPAMRTGGMKYVILRIDTHVLRIDTHVLRIDLCPRKRTRIRRQKQDEDVHLFLSERKKARPLPRTRCRGVSHTPTRRTRKGPNDRNSARTECTYRGGTFIPCGMFGGRMRYAPTLPVGGPSSIRPNLAGVPDSPVNLAGVPDAPGQIRRRPQTPWHVACRGRWVESNAGMSHAAAAGSKVTLACRMPRPLDQK